MLSEVVEQKYVPSSRNTPAVLLLSPYPVFCMKDRTKPLLLLSLKTPVLVSIILAIVIILLVQCFHGFFDEWRGLSLITISTVYNYSRTVQYCHSPSRPD